MAGDWETVGQADGWEPVRPPQKKTEKAGGWWNVLAPLDAAASYASGMVATPVAGIAGLGAALTPGLEQGAGKRTVEAVSNALTYEPRTTGGQAAMNVAQVPGELIDKAARYMGESQESIGPMAATVAHTVAALTPMAIGQRQRQRVSDPRNAVRDATLAKAKEAGYVVPPTVENPSFLNKRLEGVAGKAAIKQEVQIRNQEVTNSLAKKAVGVPDDVALTPGVLEARRDALAAPYREVAALSPRAAAMLDALKKARAEAQSWFKSYERSAHPEHQAKAESLKQRAAVLEKAIEREASNTGRRGLVDDLKAARQEIAKTYDVEAALNVGDGNVSANILGNRYDKGKKLTGELETIAKFDQAFRPFTREGSMVPTPGVSHLEHITAAGLGVGGHASGLGWLPAGLPLLSGPTRSMLLSGPFQRPPAPLKPHPVVPFLLAPDASK